MGAGDNKKKLAINIYVRERANNNYLLDMKRVSFAILITYALDIMRTSSTNVTP